MVKITEKEILSKQTLKGGWTKKTLASWGVPWPPPKGWKSSLIKNGAPYGDGSILDDEPMSLIEQQLNERMH